MTRPTPSLADDSFRAPSAPTLFRSRWIGPAIIAVATLAMLIWTWQTWTDVLVDFGVQLYVPAHLIRGEVLYRDIAHYTGPLSVYYNAAAFRLFGPSLRTLEFANFPILIGTIAAIYWLAARMGGRMCAAICAVSFVTLFAFAHIEIAGNYNYVCPYEYEYTHGMLLCLTGLIFFDRFLRSHRLADAAIIGLLAGLCFLTRSELFLALAGAIVAGFSFFVITNRNSPVLIFRALLTLFIAALIPSLISIGLLSLAMPVRMSLHGTLGMWPALLGGHVSGQLFYQHSMGIDDLHKSLHLLTSWSLYYFLALLLFAGWSILIPRRNPAPHLFIAAFIGALLIGLNWRHKDWLISFFRPLPVVAVAAIVSLIVLLIRFRGQPDRQRKVAISLIFAIFSFLLLGKVLLYARIIQYGVWLAMPATMLLLIACFGWIPNWLRQKPSASTAIYLAGVGTLWAAVLIAHLTGTGGVINTLTVPVGNGSGQFYAEPMRGIPVNNAITAIENIVPPDKTLACFPEGIMINYLARRRIPTAYVNFNPPDLLLFGEDNMVAAFEKSPPDYILIVHKDTTEFGEKYFGRDYGQKLDRWIDQNYAVQPLPMLNLGEEPLRDARFGIRLLIPRRIDDARKAGIGH